MHATSFSQGGGGATAALIQHTRHQLFKQPLIGISESIKPGENDGSLLALN